MLVYVFHADNVTLWLAKKKKHSHNLLADEDEDFIQGQHVPDEVKHVGLFLFFLDDQHRLLHRVNRLRPGETQEVF